MVALASGGPARRRLGCAGSESPQRPDAYAASACSGPDAMKVLRKLAVHKQLLERQNRMSLTSINLPDYGSTGRSDRVKLKDPLSPKFIALKRLEPQYFGP
jgi:hypothetical protein